MQIPVKVPSGFKCEFLLMASQKDFAPENFAVIRHIALNLLKNEKTAKTGIKNKRLMTGWDHSYLAKLLDTAKIG